MHTNVIAANHEAAILARVIQPDRDDFSPGAARAILKFTFPQADRDRMHELAIKNQEGRLTAQEEQELASYRRVGRLLDLLGAKARLALKQNGRTH
jgi:hypothetical protein